MGLHKRVLCLLFIIVLLPVSGLSANAQGTEPIAYKDSLEILSILGIMEDGADGAFEPEGSITRSEFTTMIIKLLNIDEQITDIGSDSMFKDVSADNPALPYITTAAKLGIVSGFGNETFRPDDNVTYEQIMIMLVNALGYGVVVKQQGNNISEYLSQAGNLNLLGGIKVSYADAATKGAVAKILHNALYIDILEAKVLGERTEYKAVKGNNILTEKFKLVKVEGIVNAVGRTKLASVSNLRDGLIEINNEIYRLDMAKATPFFANYVTAYVQDEDKNSEREVVFITPHPHKNTVWQINAKDIVDCKNNTIYYTTDENLSRGTDEIEVASSSDLILNGQVFKGYLEEIIQKDFGNVTVVDNNGDSIADAVIVTRYDVIVADSIDEQGKIVYDKINPSISLNLDDNGAKGTVKIFKNGTEISISDIKSGDVLSVAQSENDKISLKYIYVSDTKITGEIQEIDKPDKNIVINNEFYKITKRLIDLVKLGESYTFALDIENKAVDIQRSVLTSGNLAYLMMAKRMKGIGARLSLKLFTQDGEIKELTCANTITLDGVSIKSSAVKEPIFMVDEKGNIREDNKIVPQLIVYGTDSKGNVNEIDTAATSPSEKESEYSLERVFDYTDSTHIAEPGNLIWVGPNSLNTNILIDDSTVLFYIPADEENSEDSKYQIVTANDLIDISFAVTAYSLSPETFIPDAAVIKYNASHEGVHSRSPMMLVDYISTAVNKEGDVINMLYGLVKGELKSEIVADFNVLKKRDTGETIGQGDVIQYQKNGKGEVVSISYVDDSSSNLRFINTVTPTLDKVGSASFPFMIGRYNHAFCLFGGFVDDKQGTAIKVAEGNNIHSMPSPIKYRYFYTDSFSIMVYDKEKGMVYAGTTDDILPYKQVGDKCSRIFIHTRNANPQNIFIYKD
ncbi:MAG: S-layer homology domain-containing protein [Firmicutes bacterium]|nr:S-layer homology domain-containing protein [Bacillota bacterium]